MKTLNYSPDLAGKSVYNKGKLTKIRKYHLTDEELVKKKNDFDNMIKYISIEIKDLAHKTFFNPYTRRGIYFYQIQSLYLLGCNTYHSLFSILGKIKKVMPNWGKFKYKEHRRCSRSNKGYIGRLIENYFFFQRISSLNPYGYKLRQVYAALDIKILSHNDLGKVFYFRLSTYNNFKNSLPERDLSGYNGKDMNKYKGRFVGNIIE